jgi:hypothetical protein
MRVYTTWLPLGLAIGIIVLYFALPVRPALLGKDGAVGNALAILSTLPGFYFAGLAAVATFGSSDMDKEMPSPAPTIDILVSGKKVPTKLTRRLFLTYLFSYLVLLSFVLCFSLLILNTISASITMIDAEVHTSNVGEWIWDALKFIVGSVLVLLSASLAVSTLHGVFFLAEKMHQP